MEHNSYNAGIPCKTVAEFMALSSLLAVCVSGSSMYVFILG